jgi:hypothetical protein
MRVVALSDLHGFLPDIGGNIRYCFDSYQSGVYSVSFEADVREWSHAVRDVAVTDDAETASQSLNSLGPAGSNVTG